VHQNLLMATRQSAKAVPRGNLFLRACSRCGFVYNGAFDASLLAYGQDYDNSQDGSPAFRDYTDRLLERLVCDRGLRDCSIVEVGCGKGQFLRRLIEDERTQNRGFGFDPSYTGPESDLDGRMIFQKQFYDHRCAKVPADVVLCRHVIEHVDRPLAILRAVRAALVRSPHARVFFETPCVEWILRNQVTWDFFYEHCSLFTAHSIATAFQRAGFAVTSVEHVFGGQYLWLEGKPSAEPEPGTSWTGAGTIPGLAADFAAAEQRRIAGWVDEIHRLSQDGQVAIWGAGAKGATFANLVDPLCQRISCVVDVNPVKQDRYLPGTGHPIIRPAALLESNVATVVVLNPNYCDEIAVLLRALGARIDVIDMMDSEVVNA